MNDAEVSQVLRELSNRWAVEYAAAGMPLPMPLSMYPDAWLRAEADRIEAEAASKAADRARARDEWLNELCTRHEIDPARVIPDSVSVDVEYRHMWKSPMAWPAGGTYEAIVPRDSLDEMVARRSITAVSLRVFGRDARGRIEPGFSSETTRLSWTDEAPWEWFSTSASK